MSTAKFESGRDFAQAMTTADPLAAYRDRFHIPKTATGSDGVYLCGHSLGLQPKSARAYIEQELQDWERFGVEGHFHARNPWMPYHELLTASTAAAAGPGTGQVIGVAPAATILNIKVLQRMPVSGSTGTTTSQFCEAGQASGLLSWTIQGIEDAIANRADVISLSVGVTADLSTGEGAGLKAAFDQITYAANQAGIVLIAAAGNDGLDLSNPRYVELPAQSRGVLAIVASTNPACAQNTTTGATCAPGPITLAYYSNYGAPLNALAAPGGSYPDGGDQTVSGWVRGACSSGIPSTTDGLPSDSAHSFGCFNLGHTQYVQAMGTSASAPLAAGVTALIRAAHPDWDPDRVIAAMRSSAITTPALTIPQVNAATTLTQP